MAGITLVQCYATDGSESFGRLSRTIHEGVDIPLHQESSSGCFRKRAQWSGFVIAVETATPSRSMGRACSDIVADRRFEDADMPMHSHGHRERI